MLVVARRALLVTLIAVSVAALGVGRVIGWSESWVWLSSHWRLDTGIGAPEVTEPYPGVATPPLARLAAAGDVGTGGTAAWDTAAAIDALEPARQFDALLLLGDNVYPSGAPASVRAHVLDPFGGVLDGSTDLVAALGNHDVRTGDGEPERVALHQPGRWYTTDHGPVTVVVVDSTRADDPAQLEWLRTALAGAAARSEWTVVIQHHPPFSAGYHGSHRASRTHLVPLYVAAGVDLVLSGHDHDYQRTEPIDGVTYVVSGGGATLRATARGEHTVVAASTYHFVEVLAYADRLEVRAIGQDGRMFDDFSLPAS